MDQNLVLYIVAAVAAVALVALVWFLLARRRRGQRHRDALRERYGPEYDRTVSASGNEKAAVAELEDRERRRERLSLRDLDEHERSQVRRHMAVLQYRFVEEPGETLLEAGRVVTEVLRVRGYPVAGDREEALRMLAVDHPRAAQPVRALLDAEYGSDPQRQRQLFLGTRAALQEIAEISYELRDALAAGEARELGEREHGDGQAGDGHVADAQTGDDTAAFGAARAERADHEQIRLDEPAERGSTT